MTPTWSADYLKIQTARANAILGAAWDATPVEMFCPGYHTFTLDLNYSRGGAAGAVDIQIQTSAWSLTVLVPAGISEWQTQAIYAAGGVVGGADTGSIIQREYITYEATGAGDESWVYGPVRLDGAVERMRILCRESGNVGAPGDMYILATFHDEEG